MTGRTQVLSVHHLRRNARREEWRLQRALDIGLPALDNAGRPLPEWARGVRVEKAGPFSWAVVATATRGH